MEIQIVIDAPKGWKRRFLLYVVTPVGLVFAAAVVAHATTPIPTMWIQDGGVVSASQLAGDFQNVEGRLEALEAFKTQATADGGYSVNGTYCGATSPMTSGGAFASGGLQGYAAAKALCQGVSQCGLSASAHMCTGEELVRSAQLGVPTTSGWYSSSVYVPPVGAGYPTYDCNGWASGNPMLNGPAWLLSSGVFIPNVEPCNAQTLPILCCE